MLLLLLGAAHADDRIATIRMSVGVPDLIGGAVSLTALRPFELEVGGGTTVIASSVFARAGAAFPFFDREFGTRRLLVEGIALGGYRYLDESAYYSLAQLDAGYAQYDFTRHGVETAFATGVSWWFSEHFGLEVQILLGGGLWVASNADGTWPFYMNSRFSFGVGF